MQKRKLTVALAGNPNAGKTSLFNQITGARAHVGNYPGVTVEKKVGHFQRQGVDVTVVDLPGTYSLTAYSLEELVARQFILDERPDLVVNVIDATNLERNLYLAVQFMEIGVPVVIALNMMDMAESQGLKFDLKKLEQLLDTPVAPTVARSREGLEHLMDVIVETGRNSQPWSPRKIRYGADLDIKIAEITELLESTPDFDTDKFPARWVAIKALEGDAEVFDVINKCSGAGKKVRAMADSVARHLRATIDEEPEGVIADHRYGFITSITKQTVSTGKEMRRTVSDKLDLLVLNRLLGPLILLAILYGLYQFVFWFSETPVAWFEAFFGWLAGSLEGALPEGPVKSLLVSGVIGGVGGVLGFVPLIALMFFAIAILEDSGYMARIAFIMDRVLRTFGLHGNSILSLIVGGGITGGCAVPGVLAARTLRDPKERLATILVTPFMNCGAKLPVYAVLIAAFFSARQAYMMFILTLIAWGMALFSARILRWTLLRGSHTPFVMELPPYRWPTFKGLLIHTWERVWQYIKKAGTVILAISVLIWAMMTYPALPESQMKVFEFQASRIQQDFLTGPGTSLFSGESDLAAFKAFRADFRNSGGQAAPPAGNPGYVKLAETLEALENGGSLPEELKAYRETAKAYTEMQEQEQLLSAGRANAELRYSVAGRAGTALETISRPLGFDWRTNIALTGGFAAKEVVVSTLGTAYSLGGGDGDSDASLAVRLAAEPGWNPLTGFTLMLFVMLYSPCFVTLVVIGREAGWRWSLFAAGYSTILAYVVCFIVAAVGRAFGWGV